MTALITILVIVGILLAGAGKTVLFALWVIMGVLFFSWLEDRKCPSKKKITPDIPKHIPRVAPTLSQPVLNRLGLSNDLNLSEKDVDILQNLSQREVELNRLRNDLNSKTKANVELSQQNEKLQGFADFISQVSKAADSTLIGVNDGQKVTTTKRRRNKGKKVSST